MAKSIAVLGLGKYGMSLVGALYEMGADVLAVDNNEANVKEIASRCTAAVCADLSVEDNLLKLGLNEMDTVVVAMGESLEASIMSVVVAKEMGVPAIIAKSSSVRMSSILRKVGASKVIMPEEYAGARSAAMLLSDTVLDYFQVGGHLGMVEMEPLDEWVGKTLIELNMRSKYKTIVVAQKDGDNDWIPIDPEQPLKEKTRLLAVIDRKDIGYLGNK